MAPMGDSGGMAAGEDRRGLAAVMFADMVGYTALMGRDEAAAREARDRQRVVVERHVADCGGRIRQYYGDGTLSVFDSAVRACRCAVGIQRELGADRTVVLRIGIHVGDIVDEGEGVYGDGVNVAARMEALAPHGGVAVSDRVYDEIRNQRDLSATSIGRRELKNVTRPVEVFVLTNEGLPGPTGTAEVTASRAPRAHARLRPPLVMAAVLVAVAAVLSAWPVPRLVRGPRADAALTGASADAPGSGRALPSVAVIPFENRSAEGENAAFLADGLHDEVLTHLANIGSLEVIARTSVMRFADTKVPAGEIARLLDVHAVLEGRVQRAGNRILLNAQLIDGRNDAHLWANVYEKELTAENVFAIQRELAQDIARSLDAVLTGAERAELERRPTESIEAYGRYLEGLARARDAVVASDLQGAERALTAAISLDPDLAEAYAMLTYVHLNTYWSAYDHTPARLEKARRSLEHAETLAPGRADVLIARGYYSYWGERDFAAAIVAFSKAHELRPGEARIHQAWAFVLRRTGEWERAIARFERAVELDPLNPEFIREVGQTYRWMGQWDEAASWLERGLRIAPDHLGLVTEVAFLDIQRDGDVTRMVEAARSYPDNDILAYMDWWIGYVAGDDARTSRLTAGRTGAIEQQTAVYPRTLLNAMQHRAMGRVEAARAAADSASRELRAMLVDRPNDPRLHATAGIAMALLGQREVALAEGRTAVQLMPVEADAMDGQEYLLHLATIEALLGEDEAAVATLQRAFARPTRSSWAEVRMTPHFGAIRDRPELAGR